MRYHTYKSSDTNLIKTLLNDYGITSDRREQTQIPLKHFDVYRNEYNRYLEDYGVCQTYFNVKYSSVARSVKVICGREDYYTGMIVEDHLFVLPCLAPDADEASTVKLFSTVATAMLETISKLSHEIPTWIDEGIVFPQERKIKEQVEELNKERAILNSKIDIYRDYKGCLALSGETLVESVATIFESFFQFRVKRETKLIDDLKLFMPEADKDELIALVEVKGVNSGVKRENINQADSHRERLSLPLTTPVLLVVNTKQDAKSLKEKELEVASEQIKKAVQDNILIIRTLDLVRIMTLVEDGKVSVEGMLRIFQSEKGWLTTTEDRVEVRKN